jgi:hypothetical protein
MTCSYHQDGQECRCGGEIRKSEPKEHLHWVCQECGYDCTTAPLDDDSVPVKFAEGGSDMGPVPDRTDGGCTPLVDDKFIPKSQEPREPAFDLNKLKIELNNITIMYGPPDATIRRAERAMMAYISVLCDEEEA